jgi:putative ABC transport system permease protein
MPDWTPDLRARLSSVRLAPAREAEIIEELSQHLDDRWRELIAGGADPNAAEHLARAEFRDHDLLARYLSPLRQAHWADRTPVPTQRSLLRGLTADIRDAIRGLRSTPGFTIAALVVLTLGVGATTAIFSVVDAVVLRSLPFEQPDRLVAIGERSWGGKAGKRPGLPGPATPDPGDPLALSRIQPQNYLDWVAQQRVFESIAAIHDLNQSTLNLPGAAPEEIVMHRVTAGFFDVLRIRPAIGRAFTAENEVEGRQHVVVLSDALWRRLFNGDPNVLGRTVPLNDGSYEVVGVMPPGVTYPIGAVKPTELWAPYVVPENERVRGGGTGISIYLTAIARLKPGVTVQDAQAQLNQIAASIQQANPTFARGLSFGVRPLADHLVGASVRSWMLMLLTAVGIVLLIACANVANLLLARAGAREREVAVRAALGAGRWRLARQFMVESLVLSIAGTALAIGFAWWAVRMLRSALPEDLPRVMTIAVDPRVLAAAAGLAILTGLFFGVVPALQLSRPDLSNALNESGRSASGGRRRQRVRSVLVVAEIALAVVLLVGAALFIASFIRLMQIDAGFNPDNVLTLQVFRSSAPGTRPPDAHDAFIQMAADLAQTPGVINAAVASPGIPLTVNLHVDGFSVRGKPIEGDRSISLKVVTPDYHRALRIPLRRGRLFEPTDRAGSPDVVILNDAAAKHFFGGEDPVGQTVVVNRKDRVVVGVVSDARQWNLETPARTEVYLPMAQSEATSGYVVIRTSGDPYDALPAARAAMRHAFPDAPPRYVATMSERVAKQTAQRRLNMLTLGLFGLLGLVISAVGVYGLMAYNVTQRTREIGVRMALGATRSNVIAMVLLNATGLIAIGLAIGAVAAWYLGATARTFLYGLEAHDPRAFAVAVITLSVAALVATLVPARRAATVDPTVALRAE